MYLNSLKGLNKLIIETDFYKKKKKSTDKKLVIDKSNIIINSIINGNKHNWNIEDYEPIPLNVDILKKQLGRDYKKFINLLINLEIIKTDNGFISSGLAKNLTHTKGVKVSPQSKKYGLTLKAKAMEIAKVGVLTERIEKKIVKIKQDDINQYIKDKDVHYKILNNIKHLTFSINTLEDALNLAKIEDKTKLNHYTNSFNELIELNKNTTLEGLKNSIVFHYSANNKVGRVYHYYTNTPKVYREHLRHSDGSVLVELDLKNSQPLILMLLFFKAVTYTKNNIPLSESIHINNDIILWFENNKEDLIKTIAKTNSEFLELTTELDILFDKMIEGSFYKSIAESIGNSIDYKGLKIRVLKSFFSYPNENLSETEIIIKNKYPYFFEFILQIKKQRSNKELSHLAQIYESSIFINKVFKELNEDVFAIPIHDSIITTESDVYIVKRIITEAIADTFKVSTALAFQLITTTRYK